MGFWLAGALAGTWFLLTPMDSCYRPVPRPLFHLGVIPLPRAAQHGARDDGRLGHFSARVPQWGSTPEGFISLSEDWAHLLGLPLSSLDPLSEKAQDLVDSPSVLIMAPGRGAGQELCHTAPSTRVLSFCS